MHSGPPSTGKITIFHFRPDPRVSPSANGRPRPKWPKILAFRVSRPWESTRTQGVKKLRNVGKQRLGRSFSPPKKAPSSGKFPFSGFGPGPEFFFGSAGPNGPKIDKSGLATRLGVLGPGPRRFVADWGRMARRWGAAAPHCTPSAARLGPFWAL